MAKVPGNLQRIHNGQRRYAITPHIPGGFIQPQQLQKFVDVAETFKGVIKITGGQRIMITNLKAEDLEAAWDMLGMQPGYSASNVVRSVKICPGTTFCKRAKQDSVSLGLILDKKYISKEMPSKMKMGVSGCPNSCSESVTKDIGVIGTEDGWQVFAGGSGGAHPRLGDFIAEVKTQNEVIDLVDRIIAYYKAHAQIERLGEFIERVGIETFKRAVLGDAYKPQVTSATAPIEEVPPVFLPGISGTADVFGFGSPITKDTIVRELIETYPATIPALQEIGMGCLGCPSATAEPLWQAASIHGLDVNDLVARLESVRKGA